MHNSKILPYSIISVLLHLTLFTCLIISWQHRHKDFFIPANKSNKIIKVKFYNNDPENYKNHHIKITHQLHKKTLLYKQQQKIKQQAHNGRINNKLITYLYNQIISHYNYPTEAAQLQQSGTTIISFTLLKNGNIAKESIKNTSGFSDLDEAALHAVAEAAPFNKAKQYLKTKKSFTIPIKFS